MENGHESYLKEIGYEDVDKIHLAQDRVLLRALVNAALNHRFP